MKLLIATLVLLASPLGPLAQCRDADGDGFFYETGCGTLRDCNDAAATTHPEAAELCDGYDNDCNLLVDEATKCETTCESADKIGTDRRLTGSIGGEVDPVIVWNGDHFGVTWSDRRFGASREIFFRRLNGQGLPVGPEVQLSQAQGNGSSQHPHLVWNGSRFAAVWGGRSSGETIFLRLMEADGTPVGNPIQATDTYSYAAQPAIAWNGASFGLVWDGIADGDEELHFAVLRPDGTRVGDDIRLTNIVGETGPPSVIWTGDEFVVVWADRRSGSYQYYLLRVDEDGSRLGDAVQLTDDPDWSDTGNEPRPSLAWTGNELALVRTRVEFDPDFSLQVYFRIYSRYGDPVGPDLRVSQSTKNSLNASVAWTGSEFGVTWLDGGASLGQVSLQRVALPSVPQGAEMVVTEPSARYPAKPVIAWSGADYSLAWEAEPPASGDPKDIYSVVLGCNCVDRDGDEFTRCTGDCDESDPNRNPDVPELCNSLDDDCDGLIDDDNIYSEEDLDGDGVPGACDNCPLDANPTQLDSDADLLGNPCDNCVAIPNPDQSDLDSDHRGDLCDNCPADANPLQDDRDEDTVGDACDNCLFEKNQSQSDWDADFEGDHCDFDDGLIYLLNYSGPEWVEWQEEAGFDAWNAYRGALAVLRATGEYTQDPGSNPLARQDCGLTNPWVADDGPAPLSGEAAFYLATGLARGIESGLDKDSDGAERPNTNSCP